MRLYANKIIIPTETPLMKGELAPLLWETKEPPEFEWLGGKIPCALLKSTIAFSVYCNEKYGGEVQGRLYFSETKNEWATIVRKQLISRSLVSNEIEDEAETGLTDDFVYNGTWHSHANAGAFCSGTDYRNEIKQNGFHYTIGHCGNDTVSIHCRYTFRGVMYEMNAEDMFEDLDLSVSGSSFPPIWSEKLVEPPPRIVRPVPDIKAPRASSSKGFWASSSKDPEDSSSDDFWGGSHGCNYGFSDDSPELPSYCDDLAAELISYIRKDRAKFNCLVGSIRHTRHEGLGKITKQEAVIMAALLTYFDIEDEGFGWN